MCWLKEKAFGVLNTGRVHSVCLLNITTGTVVIMMSLLLHKDTVGDRDSVFEWVTWVGVWCLGNCKPMKQVGQKHECGDGGNMEKHRCPGT